MKIEAVFFDLDDTLTDWHGAVSGALEDIGPGAGLSRRQIEAVREQMRHFVCVERDGRVVERQHWRLVDSHEPWERMFGVGDHVRVMVDSFRAALLPRLRMYADFDSLKELAGRWRVAMLSNNPYARTALETQGHLQLFEAVVMAEEPFRKPHAQAFAVAAATIGCEPSTLVYVGDSIECDIEGALGADWTPIWIDRFDDRYELPGVDRISSLWELPAVLERLEAWG